MFDERSQVFYRGKKPRVFLVFQICFVDLIKVQRQYLRRQSLNFHQQLLLIQTPWISAPSSIFTATEIQFFGCEQ